MGLRFGEDPARSVTPHFDEVDYPAWRDQLVRAAMDAGAPADVINLLKSLPRAHYYSKAEALRDLAEAGRRFGLGGLAPGDEAGDRRNIGRDAVENPTRRKHPPH